MKTKASKSKASKSSALRERTDAEPVSIVSQCEIVVAFLDKYPETDRARLEAAIKAEGLEGFARAAANTLVHRPVDERVGLELGKRIARIFEVESWEERLASGETRRAVAASLRMELAAFNQAIARYRRELKRADDEAASKKPKRARRV